MKLHAALLVCDRISCGEAAKAGERGVRFNGAMDRAPATPGDGAPAPLHGLTVRGHLQHPRARARSFARRSRPGPRSEANVLPVRGWNDARAEAALAWTPRRARPVARWGLLAHLSTGLRDVRVHMNDVDVVGLPTAKIDHGAIGHDSGLPRAQQCHRLAGGPGWLDGNEAVPGRVGVDADADADRSSSRRPPIEDAHTAVHCADLGRRGAGQLRRTRDDTCVESPVSMSVGWTGQRQGRDDAQSKDEDGYQRLASSALGRSGATCKPVLGRASRTSCRTRTDCFVDGHGPTIRAPRPRCMRQESRLGRESPSVSGHPAGGVRASDIAPVESPPELATTALVMHDTAAVADLGEVRGPAEPGMRCTLPFEPSRARASPR